MSRSFVLFLVGFGLGAQEFSALQAVADSGRCATLGETPDARLSPHDRIAPGLPPLLSFRAYETHRNGRFTNSDLMLDDAGH